jgi:formylglycine-generating enzyme required for sulfatase activity
MKWRTASQTKSLTPGVYEVPESHGVRLTHIPSGVFVMGSPAGEVGRRDDETQRKITISRPFYMGTKEITQAQYMNAMHPDHVEDRMNAGPWAHHLPAFYKGGPWGVERTHVKSPLESDKPMDMLTWEEAVAYCAWLTNREAAAGRLPKGYVYRLPTEAEWEYACRAGSTGPFGVEGELDTFMDFKADIWDGTTSNPIGQRKANPWGLYDMHGSLFEWVLDGYGPYDASQTTDPQAVVPDSEKVMRGGSYMSHKPAEDKDKPSDANKFRSIRSASRSHLPRDFELPVTGMRIVLAARLE